MTTSGLLRPVSGLRDASASGHLRRRMLRTAGAPPSSKVTVVKRSRLDLCLHPVRRPLSCSEKRANVLRRSHFARSGAGWESP